MSPATDGIPVLRLMKMERGSKENSGSFPRFMTYMSMSMSMSICICICICVYIYTYTDIQNLLELVWSCLGNTALF